MTMQDFGSVNYIMKLIKSGDCPLIPFDNPIDSIADLVPEELFNQMAKDEHYIYLGPFRFSHDDSKIVEYNIDFYSHPEYIFPIELENIDENEVTNQTLLHRFILMLRYFQIEYKELVTKDLEYLILKTKSGVNIYFDLEEGGLYRVGKMSQDLPISRFTVW